MPNNLFRPEQLADFRRDGYVVVRGLYSPEQVREISGWTDAVASFPQVPGKTMLYFEDSLSEPGQRIVARIENFYPYHAGFAELLDNPGLRERSAELFGEPAVLFKDKINFKMPGGQGFTPHQDVQAGWNRYADLHITALVTIDRSTLENGCLELAAGHHTGGLVGDLWAPLNDEHMRSMEFVPFPCEPGDVVFFDSFAPHRSGPNLTDKPRRVLYVTYNKAAQGDHRAQYYLDKRRSYPPDCERQPDKQYVFRV